MKEVIQFGKCLDKSEQCKEKKVKGRPQAIFKIPAMILTSEEIISYDPIRRVLHTLEGVLEVNPDSPKGEVFVKSDPAMITMEDIDYAIRSVRYKTNAPLAFENMLKMQT